MEERKGSGTTRFDQLSERQRDYLRQVFQHRRSDEIAFAAKVSSRAVDKQLLLAKNLLGATTRFEAARMFAEYEAGVERLYPASVVPSQPAFWPLPMPVPSKAGSNNTLTWQQVLAWGVIIAIVTLVAITVAAMVIVTLNLLLGAHLQ
jgi:DNA-binding CsgD family transcriptional regulator